MTRPQRTLRRGATVAAACLGAALATTVAAPATAASGAGGGPGSGERLELSIGGKRAFPAREMLLQGPPGASFAPGDVRVLENGEPVRGAEVVRARSDRGRRSGVVLAIDSSVSMRGEPIRGAMRAARAFARRRDPRRPLAVLLFDDQARLLAPFTTDRRRIRRALTGTPKLHRGTRVYDAAGAAIALLRRAGMTDGAVVLLSDGRDAGSRTSQAVVGEAGSVAGIRIFTVGLGADAGATRALSALASDTGGRHTSVATPRALSGIFDALAARLASEYVVRYRSNAAAGQRVAVTVRVRGVGSASARYRTPPAARKPATGAGSPDEGFWGSTLARLLVSLAGAIPVTLLVLALTRPRRRSLGERVESFVSAHPVAARVRDDDERERTGLVAGVERSLEGVGWWERLRERLEIARIDTPAIVVVAGTALGAALAAWLFAAIGAGPVLTVVAGAAVPGAVRASIARRLAKQRALFADQLADNLGVIASAMRAGHSLVGAMAVVVDEAAEPSRSEFRQVVADERLGMPLEDAIAKVVRRMDSRDLDQVAMVASLQRESGGNTAEVLDQVTDNLRARFELRRLITTLTAQGRMARWIVSALPVLLLGAITVLNPGYTDPLFESGVGRAVLGLAAAMVIAGSLAVKKIVDIKA